MVQPELTDAFFERLIETYSARLLNRAYYLLSNKQDAEDVVQELFLTAFAQRDSLSQVHSAEGWLWGILYHKVADRYKERYRKPLVGLNFEHDFDRNGEWKHPDQVANGWAANPESLESLLDQPDFRQSFYDCLDRLPPKWKIIVKLCYLESQKGTAICRTLNLTPTAYWKILQRSRLQLRECIDVNGFDQ